MALYQVSDLYPLPFYLLSLIEYLVIIQRDHLLGLIPGLSRIGTNPDTVHTQLRTYTWRSVAVKIWINRGRCAGIIPKCYNSSNDVVTFVAALSILCLLLVSVECVLCISLLCSLFCVFFSFFFSVSWSFCAWLTVPVQGDWLEKTRFRYDITCWWGWWILPTHSFTHAMSHVGGNGASRIGWQQQSSHDHMRSINQTWPPSLIGKEFCMDSLHGLTGIRQFIVPVGLVSV